MSIFDRLKKDEDRIGAILYIIYTLCLILAVIVLLRILWVQFFFRLDDSTAALFRPRSQKVVIEPNRGAILACDGRLLAMSTPMYQLCMDCSVQKAAFKNKPEKEQEWRAMAAKLCDSLCVVFPERSAGDWYSFIMGLRLSNSRYAKIGPMIDHGTLQRVKKFPLWNLKSYRSGLIVEKQDTRQYPYGVLARRTIGYVKDNSKSNGNNLVGLEGKYNETLHGTEGSEWMRLVDKRRMVRDYDSTYVEAEDGLDIKTTIDIDIQDIADRALRRQIAKDSTGIAGGTAIIMDVKTGAIRAMVNVYKDKKTGQIGERYNYAVGRSGDPGSVFKTITLTACMDDGYVHSVEETMPTNHGRYGVKGKLFDQHVYDHEKQEKTDEISIIDGLKVSSNLVFHDLAVKYYRHQPEKFIEKLNQYHLLDRFAFDLDGLSKPTYNKPGTPSWSGASLGTMAYGYSITLTPLHVLMFYNSIANHGKMMKPYLVEDIESHGSVKKHMGPSVLNSSVCSRSVADSVSRALRAVVREGTGRLSLGKAKLPVAGKTGTARVVLENGKFFDEQGRFINQGTFVGFFPYDTAGDHAKYSIIVTMYSELSHRSLYGASGPAGAIREIVDEIYGLQSEWSKERGDTTIVRRGSIPNMGKKPKMPQIDTTSTTTIPDVRGLGLRDAIAIIENSGLRCSFSGVGHVKTQSPSPDQMTKKGTTITVVLK